MPACSEVRQGRTRGTCRCRVVGRAVMTRVSPLTSFSCLLLIDCVQTTWWERLTHQCVTVADLPHGPARARPALRNRREAPHTCACMKAAAVCTLAAALCLSAVGRSWLFLGRFLVMGLNPPSPTSTPSRDGAPDARAPPSPPSSSHSSLLPPFLPLLHASDVAQAPGFRTRPPELRSSRITAPTSLGHGNFFCVPFLSNRSPFPCGSTPTGGRLRDP